MDRPAHSTKESESEARSFEENSLPGLHAWSDPTTFRGRDESLDQLRAQLDEDRLTICLHASSGVGKTSFLQAGLVPALVASGRAVAFLRRPDDPGILRRIRSKLGAADEGETSEAEDAQLAALLQDLHAKGKRPVIVLDAIEELFRKRESTESGSDSGQSALARIGLLMARVAAAKLPAGGFHCHFLLAYRAEYHGDVEPWLSDVLAPARAEGRPGIDSLPHDLSRPDYYRAGTWLPPLGVSLKRSADRAAFARETFQSAIRALLGRTLRFAPGAAEALAEEFVKARLDREEDALTPQLQIVLHRLWTRARRSAGVRTIEVGDDVPGLVAEALRDHLIEGLRVAFEDAFRWEVQGLRTGAFFALLQLVDADGHRVRGVRVEDLEGRLPRSGRKILQRLSSDRVHLVFRERSDIDGAWCYSLPHDLLARQIARLRDDPIAQVRYALDEGLVNDETFVRVHVEHFERGSASAAQLSRERFLALEKRISALPTSPARARWWRACGAHQDEQWRRDRARRVRRRTAIGAVAIVSLAVGAYLYFGPLAERYRDRLRAAAAIDDAQTFERVEEAHAEWARLPFHGAMAGEEYARDLLSRSLVAGTAGRAEEALLLRARALTYDDSPEARRELDELTAMWPGDAKPLVASGAIDGYALDATGERAWVTTRSTFSVWSVGGDGPATLRKTLPFVRSASFSGDGRVVVTVGSKTDEARAWISDTGEPMGPAFPFPAGAATPSRDGSLVVSWRPTEYILYNTTEGRPLGTFPAAPDSGLVAWHPDGTFVFLLGREGLFAVNSAGERTGTVIPCGTDVSGAAFDPTGELLLVSGHESLTVWDAHTGAKLGDSAPLPGVKEAAALDESGELIAYTFKVPDKTWDAASRLVVWNRVSRRKEIDLRTDCPSVQRLVFDDEGKLNVFCPNQLLRIRLDTATLQRDVCPDDKCASFAVRPDGETVTIAMSHVPTIARVTRAIRGPTEDLRGDDIVVAIRGRRVTLTALPFEAAPRPGRDDPRSSQDTLEAQLWSAETGAPLGEGFELPATDRAEPLLFVEAEDAAIAAVARGGAIRLFDTRTGASICGNTPTSEPARLKAITLSRTSKWLVSIDATGAAQLWDPRTCEPLGPPIATGATEATPSVNAEEQTLLTTNRNGLRLWNIRPDGIQAKAISTRVVPLQHQPRHAFVPGRRLMQVSDRELLLLPLAKGEEACSFPGAGSAEWAVSPNGRWLVLHDHTLRLLEVTPKGCAPRGTALQLPGTLRLMKFAPSGDRLFAVSDAWVHVLRITESGLVPESSRTRVTELPWSTLYAPAPGAPTRPKSLALLELPSGGPDAPSETREAPIDGRSAADIEQHTKAILGVKLEKLGRLRPLDR